MDNIFLVFFGLWTLGCLKNAYDTIKLRKAYIASNIDPEFEVLMKKARMNPFKQIEFSKRYNRMFFIKDSGHPELDILAARARRDGVFMACFFAVIVLVMATTGQHD